MDAGAGHAVHRVPQLDVALSLTHSPVPAGQRWKFGLHAKPHTLVVQTGSAFGSDDPAHGAHAAAVPHAVMLSSGKQPVIRGQVWVPGPQTGPQTAAAVHADPVAHGVQSTPSRVPHVAVAVFRTQMPLHRWRPALQA